MKASMSGKEVARLFRDSRIEVDKKRKQDTCRLLAQQIAEKKMIPQMSRGELLRTQLHFVEWRYLLLQLSGMLLFVPVFLRAGQQWIVSAPYIFTGAASAFSGMLLVLVCSREEAAGIAELAASCYFNHRQLAALHIVVYGTLQLACLAVTVVLLEERVNAGLLAVGIYLLVPYLLTGCVEFAILLTGPGRRSSFTLLAAGCVMAVLNGGIASVPDIYEPASLGTWIAAFVVCVAVYAAEAAAVLWRMECAQQYV